MRKLLRYDLYRAFRQASTWVLLAIALVFAVISALDATFFSEEPAGGLVPAFGSALAGGKDILLMLSGCLCGMLIGEDFSIGAYSLAVSAGCGRWKILGGRTLSCFAIIALMLAETMLVSAVIAVLYVRVFTLAELLRLAALCCLHTVQFCALNMLCILLSFALKKKVNATAVCLFANLILLALLGLACSRLALLTPLYLKSVPVLMYSMFFGDGDALSLPLGTLLHLIVTAAIFYAAGKLFAREELA